LSEEVNVRVATLVDYRTNDWLGEVMTAGVRNGKRYLIDGIEVVIPRLDSHEITIVQGLLQTYKSRPEIRHVIGKALVSIYRTKLEQVFSDCALVHCVHVGSPIFDLAAYEAARRIGIPFVFTPLVHAEAGEWDADEFRILYEQSDALIAMTEFERQWLIEHGAQPEKVTVQGVGALLADDRFSSRQVDSEMNSAQRVIFIGQKLPSKGLEALIGAAPFVWESLPDVEFLFVGPQTAYSETLFGSVRDRRIQEVGQVDLLTKTRLLRESSLLCFPSLHESFGGVLVEAWHMGLPVVAVDTEVSRELINASRGGVYVPGSSRCIAEAIVFLLSDRSVARAMGERGRTHVQSMYTWERLTERYLSLYAELRSGVPQSWRIPDVA
jgi:glycosyltransferase involved in cell wall biosynthesis